MQGGEDAVLQVGGLGDASDGAARRRNVDVVLLKFAQLIAWSKGSGLASLHLSA